MEPDTDNSFNPFTNYTTRAQTQIAACRHYADNYPFAALPGHNLMLLVAALAADLEEAYQQRDDIPSADATSGPTDPSSVPTPTSPFPINAATDRQIEAIHSLTRTLGWDTPTLTQECRARFNVRPDDLTRQQAASFLDFLRQLV